MVGEAARKKIRGERWGGHSKTRLVRKRRRTMVSGSTTGNLEFSLIQMFLPFLERRNQGTKKPRSY